MDLSLSPIVHPPHALRSDIMKKCILALVLLLSLAVVPACSSDGANPAVERLMGTWSLDTSGIESMHAMVQNEASAAWIQAIETYSFELELREDGMMSMNYRSGEQSDSRSGTWRLLAPEGGEELRIEMVIDDMRDVLSARVSDDFLLLRDPGGQMVFTR